MKNDFIFQAFLYISFLIKISIEFDLPNTCTQTQIYDYFTYQCIQCGSNEMISESSKIFDNFKRKYLYLR